MTQSDLRPGLLPVVTAFERLGVAYLIGGSVASSALGVPRATLDVDLVADLRAEHVSPLVADLRDSYYVSEELIRDAIRRRSSFNVVHLPTMLKVDVFVLRERAFDQLSFARRRPDTIDEGTEERDRSRWLPRRTSSCTSSSSSAREAK